MLGDVLFTTNAKGNAIGNWCFLFLRDEVRISIKTEAL